MVKITDVKIDVINRKLPDVGLDSDLGRFSGNVSQGVLRIFTDQGIEGNCFIGEFRNGGDELYPLILKVLKPILIGKDPSERELIWSSLRILSSRKRMSMSAWAPVDVALWDLSGKIAEMPIYKMLGAQRHEIEPYATYLPRYTTPEGYIEEANEIMNDGFRAYKIHPGSLNTKDTIEMVDLVRNTVGDDFQLMFDPNCGYDYFKALNIGMALDDNGFYWYEDPVPYYEIDTISELTKRLKVPICMSDQSENQFFHAARSIRANSNRSYRGAADKLGITGLKKLCSLAEGFGLNCEIGTAGNPTLDMANLHVIFSVKNCTYFEWWQPLEAHQFGLTENIKRNSNGMVEATDKPGLGCDIDWDYINSNTIATLE